MLCHIPFSSCVSLVFLSSRLYFFAWCSSSASLPFFISDFLFLSSSQFLSFFLPFPTHSSTSFIFSILSESSLPFSPSTWHYSIPSPSTSDLVMYLPFSFFLSLSFSVPHSLSCLCLFLSSGWCFSTCPHLCICFSPSVFHLPFLSCFYSCVPFSLPLCPLHLFSGIFYLDTWHFTVFAILRSFFSFLLFTYTHTLWIFILVLVFSFHLNMDVSQTLIFALVK